MEKGLIIICTLGTLIMPVNLLAQIAIDDIHPDSSQTVEITLTNNSELYGYILSVQEQDIELQTPAGIRFVGISQIRSVQEVDNTNIAYSWIPDANQTRLFFTPSAKPMQKGTGYYQNIYVFFSTASYAVSNNVSISGGISLLPGLSINQQLYFISGRTGAAVGDHHYISGGIGTAAVPGTGEQLFVGFGNYTYDLLRGSLTTGITGISIMEDIGNYAILLGGDYRVSEKMAIVSENYIFPDDEAILSGGLRFIGESMTIDLAFFRPGLAKNIGFGVPYVDFVFNF